MPLDPQVTGRNTGAHEKDGLSLGDPLFEFVRCLVHPHSSRLRLDTGYPPMSAVTLLVGQNCGLVRQRQSVGSGGLGVALSN